MQLHVKCGVVAGLVLGAVSLWSQTAESAVDQRQKAIQLEEQGATADAELAWQQQKVAVLLPERLEGMEAFRSQGWNVFLAPDLPEGRLPGLLLE